MKNLGHIGGLLAAVLGTAQSVPTHTTHSLSNLTYITLEEHLSGHTALIHEESNPVFAILAKAMGTGYAKYMADVKRYRLPSMDKNAIRIQVRSRLCFLSNVSTFFDQVSGVMAVGKECF
jgi:hypothetical protein